MIRRTIAGNLQAFERRDSPLSLTPAAVAIVLVMSDGIPSVPIFQRPLNMSRHAGQIALPGGKVHSGETVEDCAIREVNEELGLVLDTADVLGLLDDFDTESGFRITPVVIWSSAGVSDLKPSRWEVLKLFVIGTPELHDTVAAAALGSTQEFSLRFQRVEVFAPTAAILYQFSEVALDGRPCRVADFYQPPFTHR
ncbi:MAG TPA: CoA pyrophosphatase [Candidatus Dormibacteraeota bacterium]|nr:CoA pyrophosphatase [Candidatus Dormibacteraeota bacterium]